MSPEDDNRAVRALREAGFPVVASELKLRLQSLRPLIGKVSRKNDPSPQITPYIQRAANCHHLVVERLSESNFDSAFGHLCDCFYSLGLVTGWMAPGATGGRKKKPQHPLEYRAYRAYMKLRATKPRPKITPGVIIHALSLEGSKGKQRARGSGADGRGQLEEGSERNLVRRFMEKWERGEIPRYLGEEISHG
jgi:hypothetical protein